MSVAAGQISQDPALTITQEQAALARRCLTDDGNSLDWEAIDAWLAEGSHCPPQW